VFLPFITQCFQYFKDALPEEWEKDKDNGILVLNNTIHALIRVFNDILNYLVKVGKVNPLV
jgi:DNA sulfur modification protein DndB